MAIINLRDYYPFYTNDEFVEVSDDILIAIKDAENQERNYVRRAIYNNAQYSLDCGDGIEHSARFLSPSPSELYERKLDIEQLYNALSALPDKQARRIYTHYILGVPQKEIARAEYVGANTISASIQRGLRNMEISLKK